MAEDIRAVVHQQGNVTQTLYNVGRAIRHRHWSAICIGRHFEIPDPETGGAIPKWINTRKTVYSIFFVKLIVMFRLFLYYERLGFVESRRLALISRNP